MRSLAAWYVKGMKHNKEFKLKLINITKDYKVADTKEAALLHSMIEDLAHIACPNEKKSN